MSISPFAVKIHHVQSPVTSFSDIFPQHDSLGRCPSNKATELNHLTHDHDMMPLVDPDMRVQLAR
jgi:hypothetical protein